MKAAGKKTVTVHMPVIHVVHVVKFLVLTHNLIYVQIALHVKGNLKEA